MFESRVTEGLAPDVDRPYWREMHGSRTTFLEVIGGLDEEPARHAVERHAEAIRALAHAAAEARLAGEHVEARRLAIAASRLCEEVAGFWPRDSWEPIA